MRNTPTHLARLRPHAVWPLAALLAAASVPAHALPSFARQTGDDCAACHIGAFGPQLTPHGMKFKLGGYTDSDGKDGHLPVSAMLVESWFKTKTDQPGGPNNKALIQEASLFLAGRLSDHVGSFAQGTWSDTGRRKFTMDNVDVRYANTLQLAGKDTVVGLSFNNNPTLTDPFNTVPAWRFPYMATEMAPGPAASPIIDGALAGQVGGLAAYGLWNDSVYAELGGYRTMGRSFLENVNVLAAGDNLDKINGVAPYWRVGYFQDQHKSAWHMGLFGFDPNIKSGGMPGPSDKYRDIGVDASYQYLGTRQHVFALNTAYIHEKRTLDATWAAGDASNQRGTVNRFDISGSYHYDQTWGLTAGLFGVKGSADSGLYSAVSTVNKPDSDGYILQADWTPLGKESSWGAPWANLRLGLQYTGYTKFNGLKNNYDGTGRNARDNNTLFAFAWAAF